MWAMISYYYNDNQLLDYKTIICSFINYTCFLLSQRDDLDVYFASPLKYSPMVGQSLDLNMILTQFHPIFALSP
jgi:hypothetical protein